MIDWNTIIVLGITVFGMLSSFWLGVRLSRGESILPSPGKIEVVEPEEPEDKYGEIWPKDRRYHEDEAV